MDSVKEYFKDYPESNECFQTSDGFLFHRNDDARMHGKSLKDIEVKKYTRSEAEGEKVTETED